MHYKKSSSAKYHEGEQNIMKVRKSLKKTLQQFAFGNVMRPHVEASFVTPCMSY